MAAVKEYFLEQIKRTNGAIEKGVVVKGTLDAARQSYHAYLGAYAYGHDPNTDYVQVAITDSNGVDAAERIVWRDDYEPEVAAEPEV